MKFSFWQDPLGYLFGNPEPKTPQTSVPSVGSSLNLTTIFGYLVVGGLVFYFGKRIIK